MKKNTLVLVNRCWTAAGRPDEYDWRLHQIATVGRWWAATGWWARYSKLLEVVVGGEASSGPTSMIWNGLSLPVAESMTMSMNVVLTRERKKRRKKETK
jgi:hypothetical protein